MRPIVALCLVLSLAAAAGAAQEAPALTKEQQYLSVILQLQAELATAYADIARCEGSGPRSAAYQAAAKETQREFLRSLDEAGLAVDPQTGVVTRKDAPAKADK